MKKVLVLSPHTDDAELGVGGTIHNLAGRGNEVGVVVFAQAPSTTHDSVSECRKALDMLGVSWVRFMEYRDCHLPEARQEALDFLVTLRDRFDLVLCPSRDDVNQDHAMVVNEAIRAFKHTSILGYEFPWNHVGSTRLDAAQWLSEEDMQAKERAIACYVSQEQRPFMRPGVARSIAETRGVEFGYTLCEAFECIRWRVGG